MKNRVLGIILMGMILGCMTKKNLQPNTFIHTKESYFQPYKSPIKEGGSGYSIYLAVNDNTELNNQKIEPLGIYFKGNYSALKYQKSGLFQGFIKNTESDEIFESEDSPSNQIKKEALTLELQFELSAQEALIVYKFNGIKKYVKIELKEEKISQIPM